MKPEVMTMLNINPLLLVGGVIGAVTALLIFAYASVKDKKTAMGFERTMADGEILRRLFAYAKPYWAKFLLVLFLMLFSIAYDIISPLIVGAIEELVAADFALSRLFASVAVYARICSPTLSPSPTSSSTRSRLASLLPALPTIPTPFL